MEGYDGEITLINYKIKSSIVKYVVWRKDNEYFGYTDIVATKWIFGK